MPASRDPDRQTLVLPTRPCALLARLVRHSPGRARHRRRLRSPSGRCRARSRIARQHPYVVATRDELRHHEGAEPARTARDQDHPRPTCCRTASIDVGDAFIDRLQVEASPARGVVVNAEQDDAAHLVRSAVVAGPVHLPLAPNRLAIHRGAEHIGAHVGNERKDLLPVPADLVASAETRGPGGRASRSRSRRRSTPTSASMS